MDLALSGSGATCRRAGHPNPVPVIPGGSGPDPETARDPDTSAGSTVPAQPRIGSGAVRDDGKGKG